ncbi:hypothetical protein [Streptomyces sp. NPDC096339]|uniref:hypothetical protein n=1 Tax=Streptomyces sp. NPDC096339 TaxID=3366086 RepID=UPI0037F1E9B6
MSGILAAVLIVAIVVGAACFAIHYLNKAAGRIAVVITALAVLVGALVPVVKILAESPSPASGQIVAPAVPNPGLPQAGTGLGEGAR